MRDEESRRPRVVRIGSCVTESAVAVNDLPEEEQALVAGALPARRAEFATGRWCARSALRQVSTATGLPLLQDEAGAPRWPAGLVGSITHTAGWTGAVAARTGWRSGVRSLGLDAESACPLPPGVLEVAASRRERAELARLSGTDGPTPWDTVLFTAKEATYKAWFPLAGTVLSHDDIEVQLAGDGRFTTTARRPASSTWTTPSRSAVRVRGRWALGPRVVVSLAVVD